MRVVVTGAGRDTGRAIALSFAERGAHVYASARDAAAAEKTASLIQQRGVGSAEGVNLVSACGEVGHRRPGAHPAFYAAKHAQAGFAEIMSYRLRPAGVRVISLFPPDFHQDGPRTSDAELTLRSVVDCIMFAVAQPRDCFIREFRFEQERSPQDA